VLIGIVSTTLVVGHEQLAALLETPEAATLLLVGGVYLVFQSLNSYTQTVFQGFNQVELSAVVNVANNVTRVGFVVAFTVLGLGVVGAMMGYLVGAMLAAGVGIALLYRRFYVTYDDDGGEKTLRNRMLRYSIPLTASTSASILDNRIDTVLVGFFLNPVAVSYYVLSKQISEFVLVPAGSLGFSVSPTYGEQKANDALEEAARIYESTLQYVLLPLHPGGRRADPRRRSGHSARVRRGLRRCRPRPSADGDLRHLPGDHQRDDQRAGLPRPGRPTARSRRSYLRRQRRPQRAL